MRCVKWLALLQNSCQSFAEPSRPRAFLAIPANFPFTFRMALKLPSIPDYIQIVPVISTGALSMANEVIASQSVSHLAFRPFGMRQVALSTILQGLASNHLSYEENVDQILALLAIHPVTPVKFVAMRAEIRLTSSIAQLIKGVGYLIIYIDHHSTLARMFRQTFSELVVFYEHNHAEFEGAN